MSGRELAIGRGGGGGEGREGGWPAGQEGETDEAGEENGGRGPRVPGTQEYSWKTCKQRGKGKIEGADKKITNGRQGEFVKVANGGHIFTSCKTGIQ